ncbi:MAG: sensor domain-containing diguanylate cyclase [Candidatus Omnitrophica bacterium]|jgi:diguanylate cyclase (GGDEF)-like protein|nr:sensor domain-containing diguanylate cyclase [Candidatus Omnitrophota bacterium]
MHQKISRKKLCLLLSLSVIVATAINLFILHQRINPFVFIFFLLSNISIFFYLLKFFSEKNSLVESQLENIKEQINITNSENLKAREFGAALKFRITRYNNLKKVIEELNRSLRLEVVVNVLSSTVYSLISNSCGSALFYLLDNHTQKLSLIHSIKEDRQMVILSKEGDIFDYWVLRHSRELLIEDLKNDFRFDLDVLRSQEMRPILSLISSPLISHHSLLGLLRLESDKRGSFNQDDLRFLSLVSGLGAVALENSLLFQKTQDLAIHDDLTGLYTKQYFISRLKDEAKRCLRLDQRLALMMIDIDFFKQYNDKFGHTAGDIVLKKVSSLLKESLSLLNPLLCRFGGEEFLVMLPEIDKQRALEVAEELRQKIGREKILLRRQNTSVTVSIGLACLPLDTKDDDELIQKADKSMYDAKRKGRNRVCFI